MRSLQHSLASAILVLSMVTSVLAGPFEEAIAAYNRQDYTNALQLLRPLAERGNVRAQFLLGFMYEGERIGPLQSVGLCGLRDDEGGRRGSDPLSRQVIGIPRHCR
jgi:TPR repeat protein